MTNSTNNTDDRWKGEVFIAEDQYLNFFANQFISDVTFIIGADKKRIPGHKFILSQSSYEFYNAFNNIKLDKNELLMKDVTEEVFLCFLKYFYTGKIELDGMDGIDGLAVLKLAYHFQVKSLIEKCETYLCELVMFNNCLEFYIKGKFLNQDSKLKEEILNQIGVHFESLTSEEDQKQIFNDLPLEALREIVDFENFECDEMEIFVGIINWAKCNCEKKNISCEPKNLRWILEDVFFKIRFPTMKLDWFAEIILKYPNLFTLEEISDIIRGIKCDRKSCSKFSNNLRKRGYAFVVDPFTLHWNMIGNPVACFPGSFQLRNDSSSEMSIRFMSDYSIGLVGFAFISKRKQNPKFITCNIKQKDESASNQLEIDTETNLQLILSWDYCLTVAVFDQQYNLGSNIWYNLYCKIDCDMVNVKLDPPYSTGEFCSEGIHIKKGKYNIIPYLIFEIII